MQDVWRLFAAIELTAEVKQRVAEMARQLADAGWRARWVDPEHSHLTLKFFDNLPVTRVDELSAALARAAQAVPAFALRAGGAGVFPNPRRPRVIWLGLKGDSRPIQALVQQVEEKVTQAGFDPEQRPFHPHITVGRIKAAQQDMIDEVEDQMRALSRLPALPLPVEAVTLFRSTLTRGGPVYSVVERFPLLGDDDDRGLRTG